MCEKFYQFLILPNHRFLLRDLQMLQVYKTPVTAHMLGLQKLNSSI